MRALVVLALLFAAAVATTPRDALHRGPLRESGHGKGVGAFIDLIRPTDVDAHVDCGLKQAAYDYARKILPERGSLVSVFDALQLGVAPCNLPRPDDVSSRAEVLSAAKGYYANSHHSVGVTLYVDAAHGRDAVGGGTVNAPFKSIEFALGQSRALRPTLPEGTTIQIVLRGGLYTVLREIVIEPEDSFLDIGAFGDEEPVLSAGCPLTGLSWTRVAPPVPLPGGGVIYAANVSATGCGPFDTLFVNGRRAVRARYPNANPETSGLHTRETGYIAKAKSWLPPVDVGPAMEVHIDEPSRASHYPTFAVGIGGSVHQFDPPVSYFGPKAPVGGGTTYAIASGLVYDTADLPNRTYVEARGGVVHAMHFNHWGGWQFLIDSHNATDHSFHWHYGGFQEARGEARGGSEFYIENIFEELDSPGEWFLNRTTQLLYYYPNETDFASALFTATGPETILRVDGSMKSPVRNVSIHGLTFTQTAVTFLKRYEAPSGGDWSVHRGATLFVEGGENIIIAGNTFNATGGNAVFLSNYNRGAVVARNEFFLLGDSAIVSVGTMRLSDGTDGNQPRGNLIEGNIAYDFGVYGKQVCGYVQSLTCQATVRNNVFFNGPRAGINLNDGFGGENVVEGNLGFNLVRESSDHGPFNSWDRVPYLHDLDGDGVATLLPHMNTVTGNFFINNYYSAWPIDHDDGSMYYYDTKNLLVYGGYKQYLGHHQTITNNLYIFPDAYFAKMMMSLYCVQSTRGEPGTSGYSNVWANNECIMNNNRPIPYELLPCDPSDTQGLIPWTSGNTFYTRDGTFSFSCGGYAWDIPTANEHGYDTGSRVMRVPSNADILAKARAFVGLDAPAV